MSNPDVYRLTSDLRNGNSSDAANVVIHEIQMNPQAALELIRQANYAAGPDARIHVGTGQNGDLAIVDQSGRPIARLGNVNQIAQQGFDPNNDQQRRFDPNIDQQRRFDPNFDQQRRFDPYNQGQNQLYDRDHQELCDLARDLVRGDTRNAVGILHDLMERRPGDIQNSIREANRLADQFARQQGRDRSSEHIGTRRDGDVAIVDERGRPIARAGNIYDEGIGDHGQQRIPIAPSGYTRGYGPTSYIPEPVYGPGPSYVNTDCFGTNPYGNRNNAAITFGLGALTGAVITSIVRGGGGGYHRHR